MRVRVHDVLKYFFRFLFLVFFSAICVYLFQVGPAHSRVFFIHIYVSVFGQWRVWNIFSGTISVHLILEINVKTFTVPLKQQNQLRTTKHDENKLLTQHIDYRS